MSKVVADTSVVVALLDAHDVHNRMAVELVRSIEDRHEIVLADCILNEVYSVFARRCAGHGQQFATVVGSIREIGNREIVRTYTLVAALHDRIVGLMSRTDGKLSYHDSLIALAMKRMKLRRIATFDADFTLVDWLSVISS